MVKKELVNELTKRTGLKRVEADRTLNALLEIITETLSQDKEVIITGFGKFGVRHTAARICRNPSNGEEVQVPAKTNAYFKQGKLLKEELNK